MNIKGEIVRIFEENGVDVYNSGELENIDSIQYITIIVEIEQLLNIALPDFVLSENAFEDIDRFVNIVTITYEKNLEIEAANQNYAMLSNEHIET